MDGNHSETRPPGNILKNTWCFLDPENLKIFLEDDKREKFGDKLELTF